MIERNGDLMEICCDECPAGFGASYDSEDFDIMVDDAKRARWRLYREGSVWRHQCPECAGR